MFSAAREVLPHILVDGGGDLHVLGGEVDGGPGELLSKFLGGGVAHTSACTGYQGYLVEQESHRERVEISSKI